MSDSYTKNLQFEWSYCKYIWESHLILPYLNIERLKNIVEEHLNKTNKAEEFFS